MTVSLPRLLLCSLIALYASLSAIAQTGPLVGTVKLTEAHFLYRPGAVEKNLRLSVLNASQQVVATSEASSLLTNDHVARFHVTGLTAATAYTYRIEDLSTTPATTLLSPADGLRFKTAAPSSARTAVTAAFASCANATAEPVWQRIAALKVDQLIFGGDTPYVDVADLPTIRQKQRAFLETPMMQSLIRSTSAVGTWDDHDFGLNNGNGVNAADRRVNTRRGFTEYRAHDQFGTGTQTFTNGLGYASSATLVWDLTANTTADRGTNYDAINVTAGSFSLADGALINLVFGENVDFSQSFWLSDQEWLVIDLSGTATADDSNVFAIGTINGGVNYDPSLGSFGVQRKDGSTTADAVYLTWTAVPEPSTTLLSLFSLSGLLLRRRR